MMLYENYQYLKFDRPSERVLRITINRPEKLNSLHLLADNSLNKTILPNNNDKTPNII